jgi:hypothetical protein
MFVVPNETPGVDIRPILRAKHGSGYQPPAATGMFADVPVGHPFARWIEELSSEGITGAPSRSTSHTSKCFSSTTS